MSKKVTDFDLAFFNLESVFTKACRILAEIPQNKLTYRYVSDGLRLDFEAKMKVLRKCTGVNP